MVIRIKKGSHIGFVSLFALLAVLLFVRYSFNIEIPRMVLTLVVISIALIGSQDETLAILLCCIPFHEAIDFYIVLFAGALILILKSKLLMNFSSSIYLAFFVLVWELSHCILFKASLMSFLVSIVPIAFLVMILHFNVSEIDYPFIVRSVAFAAAVLSTVVLLNSIVQAEFDFVKGILSLQRLGEIAEDKVMLGGRINPNSLGVINVSGVTTLLQLRFKNQQRKIDYYLCIVLIIFGVLTSSRTFLVCLLLMVLLLILGQKGDVRKRIRFISMLTVAAIVAWLLLIWLFPSILEYYFSRFQVGDITTGRIELMMQYHEYMVNNPLVWLFGIGAADMSIKIHEIANNVPHNSIQEIILVWGIPGLVMMVLLIVIMITESKRYANKKILLNFIPLIIILVKSMAGQLVTSGYTMLMLVLAYLSLCQDFTSERELDKNN